MLHRWNDAATGGPNASIRFITKHEAFKDLEKAVEYCGQFNLFLFP